MLSLLIATISPYSFAAVAKQYGVRRHHTGLAVFVQRFYDVRDERPAIIPVGFGVIVDYTIY
jgi:hypothetical protein